MRRMNLSRVGATAFLLVLALFVVACGDLSETGDDPTDGDITDIDCDNNADCQEAGDNATCNITAGVCIVHGKCQGDPQCSAWYGDARPYCVNGLCDPFGSSDGDVADGDEPPDGDEDTCPIDFSGLYLGEYVCGDTEIHNTWVAQDYQTCALYIFHDGQTWSGTVGGSRISITQGISCTGTGQEFGDIVLSCTNGCEITLSPQGTVTPPDGEDPPAGVIRVAPSDEMGFGAVDPGSTVIRGATIENLGSGPMTFQSIFLTASTSDEFRVEGANDEWATPKQMPYGGRGDLRVSYSPRVEAARQGMLVILSDATNQPVTRIRIHSDVKASPKIEAEPGAVGFGSAPPGFCNTKYFLVKNTGTATANVTDIRITQNPNNLFDIQFNPENTPVFSVDAGYSVGVSMTCCPVDDCENPPCRHQGQLEIDWLDREDRTQTTSVDLLCEVSKLQPPCIDINRLEGTPGMWGLGDMPGPGIKFGYRQIGVPHSEEIRVTNCGDLPLELTGLMWNEGYTGPPLTPRAFAEQQGHFSNHTLNRREQKYLKINYYPVTEGAVNTAAWQFMTNAEQFRWLPGGVQPPDTPPEFQGLVVVGASGIAAKRGISVLPSKLDFGLITLGCCSRPDELTIYNVGDLALVIGNIAIGAGSDQRFELLNLPRSYPVSLGGAGNPQSLRFQVKFCPTREGAHTARVEITSNDDANSQLIVPLAGEGTTQTHQKDTFIQNTHPMVDVLWVIDYSGSMSEEQDKVKRETNKFVNKATQWNADMNLAVTSMDLDREDCSGNFIGEPPVLSNRGPNALSNSEIVSKFNARASMSGTRCQSGAELGLEAAHLALSEPLISGRNKGFLREDAKLSIIFLSDEEDQSIPDIPFYIDFFRSIKGMRNVNMIEIYAIVGDHPRGCDAGEDGTASAGTRYIQVADACNVHEGIHFHSICADNYERVFDTMSEHLFALRNQFFLSRLADPNTIVVSVNGASSTNWQYDDVSNSILFPESSPPAPGARIVVEYDTLCLH